jgi:hypothetical protein
LESGTFRGAKFAFRNFYHKSIELSNLKRFFVLLVPSVIVLGTGVRIVHFHAGYGRLRARIWRCIVAPNRIDDIPPASVKVEINPNVEATSKECFSDERAAKTNAHPSQKKLPTPP